METPADLSAGSFCWSKTTLPMRSSFKELWTVAT